MPRAGRRPRRRRQTGGQTPETGAQARAREAASVAPPPSMPPAPATTPPPVQTVRPRRGTPRPAAGAQSGGRRGRLYRLTHPRFVMEIIAELRKVVWPSRAETRSLSTVVIVIAIAVGILLGSVDWVFNRLMENVLLN